MEGLLYGLVCLIWGSTWLAIKIGLQGVPPFLGAGLRMALASAVLSGLSAARPGPRAGPGHRTAVLSSGILGFFLNYACVYWAEQHIPSGLAAILFGTMPLFTALLSHFWTRAERLSGRKLAGIAAGMAGTAILFWPQERPSGRALEGMAAVLAASLAAAVNLVIQKRHSERTDIFALNAAGTAIGAAGLLALSALREPWGAVAWTQANVLALLYLALAGTVAAFLAFYRLIRILPATLVSLITLIFPVVALGLGWAVLGERPGAGSLPGIALILLGTAFAASPARKPLAAAAPPCD